MMRGKRAKMLIYEDLMDKETKLSLINKLCGEEAQEIIYQAKHLSETTTLTFQEALNQVIEEYKK